MDDVNNSICDDFGTAYFFFVTVSALLASKRVQIYKAWKSKIKATFDIIDK